MNNEIVEALATLKPQMVDSSNIEFEKVNGEIQDPLKKAIYDMLKPQAITEAERCEEDCEHTETVTDFNEPVDEFNTAE